jgi:cysteine desulfuration protein SufE
MSTASPTRPPSLEKIIQRFQRLNDPKQRYELLIWYAKRLQEMPPEYKVPENKVQGCTSQVFVTATLSEGNIVFWGDSDSQLVKGLVAILVEGLSGVPPAEILGLMPDFIQDTGLDVSLTPSRANGFYNIFQMMKLKVHLLP